MIRHRLDRVAVPVDEDGQQLFSEFNPGYIVDLVTQASLAVLSPIVDEILEEVTEIEEHFHNDELWWGRVAGPTQDHAIDDNTNRPYTLTSGNNDWGVAVPIIGRLDNPVKPWQIEFDMHRIAISAVDNVLPWKIRFLYGNQSFLEARNAYRWTQTMSIASGVGSNIGAGPSDIRMRVLPLGYIVWAQCRNVTLGDTISFFIGVHGYPVRDLPYA